MCNVCDTQTVASTFHKAHTAILGLPAYTDKSYDSRTMRRRLENFGPSSFGAYPACRFAMLTVSWPRRRWVVPECQFLAFQVSDSRNAMRSRQRNVVENTLPGKSNLDECPGHLKDARIAIPLRIPISHPRLHAAFAVAASVDTFPSFV